MARVFIHRRLRVPRRRRRVLFPWWPTRREAAVNRRREWRQMSAEDRRIPFPFPFNRGSPRLSYIRS